MPSSGRWRQVAYFASAFHPSLGGVEELVRQLGHQCRRHGFPALILTNRWPRDLPAKEDFEGLAVRRHRFRLSSYARPREVVTALLTQPFTLRAICDQLARYRSEVIHVQCVSSNAHYAMLAARRLNLPFVVSLQGELTMDATGLYQRSAPAREMLRRVLDAANAITACSRQTLEEAEEFYGRSFGSRGSVVYNGISLGEFKDVVPYKHPRPYFFGIGRHVPQKGFDILLEAYSRLVSTEGSEMPDLLLAGDGPLRPSLQKLAADLGLERRAHLVGRTERVTTASLFAGCQAFILPSRHEPMGIVNLEAMAAGKPVIATRVGGVPEIVPEGECGLLLPAENVEAMTAAMLRLVKDPELRERFGAAGRKHAASFDWEAIWNQYQTVYERAAEAFAQRAGRRG